MRRSSETGKQGLVLWLMLFSLSLAACSPAPTRIVIEWTTATEINTAGFNLYRSESKDGPFTKVNATLVPASNDPLVGGKYRYEDTSVTPGRTYYYQLEDVEFGGASKRHGPIVVTASAALGAQDVALMLLVLGVLAAVGVYWRRRTKHS